MAVKTIGVTLGDGKEYQFAPLPYEMALDLIGFVQSGQQSSPEFFGHFKTCVRKSLSVAHSVEEIQRANDNLLMGEMIFAVVLAMQGVVAPEIEQSKPGP